MTFANPGYLFLLLLLIPVIGWYIYELWKSDASVQISDTSTLAAQPKSWRIWLLHVPFALRVAIITLLSIALARPQLTNKWSSESTEGIDIMMAPEPFGSGKSRSIRLRHRPSERPDRTCRLCRREFYAMPLDHRPCGARQPL